AAKASTKASNDKYLPTSPFIFPPVVVCLFPVIFLKTAAGHKSGRLLRGRMQSATPNRNNLAAIRLERLRTFGSALNSAGYRIVFLIIGAHFAFGRFCGKNFASSRPCHPDNSPHLGWKEWRDRKSTRLNSSHLVIS